VPQDAGFRTVFPDPAAAAERFWTKHGFVPVNHVLVARESFVEERPEIVADIVATLSEAIAALPTIPGGRAMLPSGRTALQPSVELAIRYLSEQAMLPRTLDPDEVWPGGNR
jgi:4,5-dihydroxyphthalate decarboxylase